MGYRKEYTFIVTDTGCHVVTSKIDTKGGSPRTARTQFGKRTHQPLFRFLYQEKYGELPSGMILAHTCGSSKCINPEHGKPVTSKELYELILCNPITYDIDENGCHICTSHCTGNSRYPCAVINGEKKVISRMYLEEKLGRPLGKEMYALHTCDNPKCINPQHLFEGTAQDNMDDAKYKGRIYTGGTPRKLTKEQVKDLRQKYTDLVNNAIDELGVTRKIVLSIIHFHSWKNTD